MPDRGVSTSSVRFALGLFVAVLAATAGVRAQQRAALTGVVVRADGTAAAGAKVVLAHAAPEGVAWAATDVVRAAADAAGRFTARVIPGAGYSGFATLEVGDDKALVSAVQEHLSAAVPVRFVVDVERAGVVITVANAAAWQPLAGPLSLRVSPAMRDFVGEAVAIDRDGRAHLPPLAGTRWCLDVCDGRGEPLHREHLAAGATEVPLPPPCAIPVLVVDEAGVPVADVAIEHEIVDFATWATTFPPPPWRRVFRRGGATARDGTATVHAPRARSPFEHPEQGFVLLARKDGFGESQSGWDGFRFEDGREEQNDRDRLRFVLHRGQRCSGSVVDGGGAGVAGLPVHVLAEFDLGFGHQFTREWVVRTDAKGRFVSDAPPANARVLRVTPAPLPGPVGTETAVLLPAWPAVQPLIAMAEERDLRFSPRAVRRIAVRATTAAGAPIAGGAARLAPLNPDATQEFAWSYGASLDADGRAVVQIATGDWLLVVTDGKGIASIALDEASEATANLVLQPFVDARFRIVDDKGAAVVGARIDLVAAGGGTRTERRDELLDGCAFDLATLSFAAARPDAEGRCTVPMFARPGFTFGVVATDGRRSSAQTAWAGSAAEQTVVVR